MNECPKKSFMRISVAPVILAFFLLYSTAPTFSEDSNAISLGGHPVCEASAALIVKCPNSEQEKCLLVGDNEQRQKLFLYRIDGDRLSSGPEHVDITTLGPKKKKKKFELSDIEALASLSDNEILIYGSHSRNKTCEIKKKRRIFVGGRLKTPSIAAGSVTLVRPEKNDEPFKCGQLFTDPQDPVVQKVCAAIERTENHAENVLTLSGEKRKSACDANPALNIEGVIVVTGAEGHARVWVGLRAPLVEGKAVLLRQVQDMTEFKFDAAVFLKLDGKDGANEDANPQDFGIRELTYAVEKVWGIGGPAPDPPEDNKPPHTLWRFDPAVLKHGATIQPTVVATDLPTSAEGLAIVSRNAFILVDGDWIKGTETCRTASEYIVRRIAQ